MKLRAFLKEVQAYGLEHQEMNRLGWMARGGKGIVRKARKERSDKWPGVGEAGNEVFDNHQRRFWLLKKGGWRRAIE